MDRAPNTRSDRELLGVINSFPLPSPSTESGSQPTSKSCLHRMANSPTGQVMSHRGCTALEGLAVGVILVLAVESWMSEGTSSATRGITTGCFLGVTALLLLGCGFSCFAKDRQAVSVVDSNSTVFVTNSFEGRPIEEDSVLLPIRLGAPPSSNFLQRMTNSLTAQMLSHPFTTGWLGIGTGVQIKLLALSLASGDSASTVGVISGCLIGSGLLLTFSCAAPWINKKLASANWDGGSGAPMEFTFKNATVNMNFDDLEEESPLPTKEDTPPSSEEDVSESETFSAFTTPASTPVPNRATPPTGTAPSATKSDD